MKMARWLLTAAVLLGLQGAEAGVCVCFIANATPLISHVSVTNHAGRVVTGEFGGVTNGTFVVSGKAYPLSILPKDEQLRVKKLAGCDVRTAKQKRLDRAREMQLERIRLREEEGEIDKDTADRLRAENEAGSRFVPSSPNKGK